MREAVREAEDLTRGSLTPRPKSGTAMYGKAVLIASAAAIVVLLLLPVLVSVDGKTHTDWQLMLGRLHPLAVHLPIGILLMVPVLEIAGRSRAALREAAGFLLSAAVVCSAGAVVLGLLLAHGGGFTRAAVHAHMWGGVWVAVASLLCWLVRPLWASGRVPYVYPGMLVGTVLLMAWTSHQGGSLTYGKGYLTEYLPMPFRRWFTTITPKPLVTGSVFAQSIYPVLDANCVACHGASKSEGGLRLDAYEYLMQGGNGGAVIQPGKPEASLLFHRITLPSSDKKFMPAEGKPPLKAEEIEAIRAWILAGASPSAAAAGGANAGIRKQAAPLPPVGDYSGLMGRIPELERALGIRIASVSMHPGDGLILRTIDAGAKFNDAELAQVAPFAPFIVDAELGRTGVTDACFATLAKFTHLRELHLEGTAVTGSGVQQLSGLAELSYINLTETKVTPAAAAQIAAMKAGMKSLEHVYLYNTPAQPANGQAIGPSAH